MQTVKNLSEHYLNWGKNNNLTFKIKSNFPDKINYWTTNVRRLLKTILIEKKDTVENELSDSIYSFIYEVSPKSVTI